MALNSEISQRLQYDTLTAVISAASVYNKNCQSYLISYTKLDYGIKYGVVKNNRYVEGYWQEKCTVINCSMKVDISIMFVYNKDVKYSRIKNK